MRINRQGRKYNPERKVCKICKRKLCDTKGKNIDGLPLYKTKCRSCRNNYKKQRRERANINTLINKVYVKLNYCEHCNFIALHRCQLDIDHIDGDSSNNDISNFQTLCANCHRLKTQINKDYKKGE